MNENIRSIAERAAALVVSDNYEEMMVTTADGGAELRVPAAFILKFAELLVEEAADLVSEFTYETEVAEDQYEEFEASEVLRGYFGEE